MAQGSNPTTNNHGPSEVSNVNAAKTTSVVNLGSVFTNEANPRRVDLRYESTSHTFSSKASSGSNPTVVFRRFRDFLNRGQHEGHRISRVGSVSNHLGTAEIYFCQDDNTICYDNLS